MTEITYWVLHSPYPDKTWRGVEKCALPKNGDGPLMFDTKEQAQEFLLTTEADPYFLPVMVILQVPDIRAVLTELQ